MITKVKIVILIQPFMTNYVFAYNLEKDEEIKNPKGLIGDGIYYGVRYFCDEKGEIYVEIGDGYRHEIFVDGNYWNRILKIIKNNELNESGISALVRGLMRAGLREEYADKFISAVVRERIKEL